MRKVSSLSELMNESSFASKRGAIDYHRKEKSNYLDSLNVNESMNFKPQFSYWETESLIVRIDPEIGFETNIGRTVLIKLIINFESKLINKDCAKLCLRMMEQSMHFDYPNSECKILEVGKHLFHTLSDMDDRDDLDRMLDEKFRYQKRPVDSVFDSSIVLPFQFGKLNFN